MDDDALKLLHDRMEIADLTAAYNSAVDDGDPVRLGGLFVEDAVFEAFRESTGEMQRNVGREQIAEIAEGRKPGFATHLTTDALVVVNGDSARQTVTVLVLQIDLESNTYVLGAGRYEDALRRTSEGWRFVSRKARVRHVMPDARVRHLGGHPARSRVVAASGDGPDNPS